MRDAGLSKLARAFGCTIDGNKDTGLVVKHGGYVYTLPMGDVILPSEVGGRNLNFPCQIVDGIPYAPLVAVGDMLSIRITIDKNGKIAWADPILNNIYIDEDNDTPQLVVLSNHDVSCQSFTLKNPDRFVIDIKGGVINSGVWTVESKQVGTIRLGQFSLTPAVARIVIPLASGCRVTMPKRTTGRRLAFPIYVPKSRPATIKVNNNSSNQSNLSSASLKQQNLLSATIYEDGEDNAVWLKMSGPVRYEWTRLISPDYRFFVDLPDVVLVGGKRQLTMRNSDVKSVRISQHSNYPRPVTRVVVDMKRPLDVNVRSSPNFQGVMIVVRNSTVPENSELIKGEGLSMGENGQQATADYTGEHGTLYKPTLANPNGNVRTICIDPGHGGADGGAANRMLSLAEEDVTLDIALRLSDVLRRSGWKVVLTRETDRDVSYPGSTDSEELWARAKVANECCADVFISIHCNAAANTAASGTSIHVYKAEDRALAEEMIAPLIRAVGRQNRGVQQDRFYVLAHTNMPAVLVETAFITNAEDARILGSPGLRQKIAEGLAEGLNAYGEKYLTKRPTARQVLSTPSPDPAVLSIPKPRYYIVNRPASKEKNYQPETKGVLPQSVLK